MNTLQLIFRRFGLVLLGLAFIAIVDVLGRHNLPLTTAAAVVVFIPVLLWLLRPKALRGDTLEQFLLYSLLASVPATLLVSLMSWLVAPQAPEKYSTSFAVGLVVTVVVAHGGHMRMRQGWKRQGARPRWADGAVLGLTAVGGFFGMLLSLNAASSYDHDDASSSQDDRRLNPSTGLWMTSGSTGHDVGGTEWGASPSDSFGSMDFDDHS